VARAVVQEVLAVAAEMKSLPSRPSIQSPLRGSGPGISTHTRRQSRCFYLRYLPFLYRTPTSLKPQDGHMDNSGNPHQELLTLTTNIVAAFVGHNSVAAGDLPALVSNVFRSLSSAGLPEMEKPNEGPTPAVPIKKSITPDFLVCLEDGRKMKMLKRYLADRYKVTPEQYRQRWGLPADYPMIAPNYAIKRSELAKSFGLGRKQPALPSAPVPPPRAPEPVSAALQPQRRVGGRRRGTEPAGRGPGQGMPPQKA
jgi:predicted transcriptional regulator